MLILQTWLKIQKSASHYWSWHRQISLDGFAQWFFVAFFLSFSLSLIQIHINNLACLKFGWMRFAIVVFMIIIKIWIWCYSVFQSSVFHLACAYLSSSIIFLPLCLYIKYAYKTFSFNFKFKLCIREMFHKVCNWHWVVWARRIGREERDIGLSAVMNACVCVAFLGLIFFETHSFLRNFVFAVDTFNTSYIWYEVLKNICNTFSFKLNIKQAKINQSIGLCMFVLYIKLVLKMRLTTFIW